MKRAQVIALSLLGAALVAAGFYAGRHASSSSESSMPVASAAPGPADKKVLYWHDPMVPGPLRRPTGRRG